MIGTIIGGVLETAKDIYATYKGAKESKRLQDAADAQVRDMRAQNRHWYDVRMSRPYTERADAQAALARQRELYQDHIKRSRAMNAVAGGGSNAQIAAQQQAAANGVADTTRSIAAAGERYKDAVENQFQRTDLALQQQQVQQKYNQAAEVVKAASQVADGSLLNAGASFDNSAVGKAFNEKVGKIISGKKSEN